MTGTSSFNGFGRLGCAALVAAALLSAGAGALMPAAAGERKRDCCGGEQFARATALEPGAREQGDKDDSERDRRRGRSGGEGRGGSGYDFGWGYGKGHPDMRAPRQHEWEETRAFMRLYAPRRLVAVDQMPDGDAKESMKRYWFARYRSLQSIQRRDPAGHEQRLAQLRVEDQVFGVVSDWTGSEVEADRQQLRESLKSYVGQLVDLDLTERQRKVESLKRELAEQTERLESDRQKREELVDKRVDHFADWAGRWAARRKQTEAEKQQGGDKQKIGEEKPDGGRGPSKEEKSGKKND